MKIVITGALGHIGSRLLRELPQTFPQVEIVLIDNLLTQRYCSLFNLPATGHYRFVEADVLTADLRPLVAGAEAVVHLAAITDAASSFKNKDLVEHNNLNATIQTAEACAAEDRPLIFLSSTSVYGTQATCVDETCAPVDLKPQSPYANTKLKEERYLQVLGEAGRLRFVICRLGTVCGVSPGMRFHTAVNKFCWQAVMGQPLTVWRTALRQQRPYLALDDALRAFQFILQKRLFDNRVYNVLTANLTVQEIIELIRPHVLDLKIEYVDQAIMNQLSYEVSNARFKEQGFQFCGSVEKSIAATLELLQPCHAIL